MLTTVLVEVTVMRAMAAVPVSRGGGGRPASCQPAPTTAMGMGAATVPHNSAPVTMATQVGVGGATQVGLSGWGYTGSVGWVGLHRWGWVLPHATS